MKSKRTNSMSKSTLQMALIIILSIISGLSVFSYTSGVERRVKADLATTNVYVVTKEIPSGTPLATIISNGYAEKRAFPNSSIPTGAITEAETINNTKVALQSLQPGQILLTGNLGDSANNTGSLVIPNGNLAVTVSMSDPAHVATFLQPGSEITVFVTGQNSKTKFTQVLIPKTQVLAVGADVINPKNGNATTASSPLITLLVTPTDSKRLIFASQNYALYFGIRTDGVDFAGSNSITDKNLLD